MRTNKYSDFDMQKQLTVDIEDFVATFPLRSELQGKTIMVTGATGLVGASCVRCLLAMNEAYPLHMRIVCVVRNMEKARQMFGDAKGVEYVECDFGSSDSIIYDKSVDGIIHCASPTASRFFVEAPVETISTAWNSCKSVLDFARNAKVESVVFVSSLEVYGTITDDSIPVTENVQGYINPLDARSSYSMGKRMAECLFYSYFKEYGVGMKVARLTQTFGAGVSTVDNRVFAQFARSVINGEDLILHTDGSSAKPYCYTMDCVSAILYILLKGENGEAYNVANEETYISIRDMAEFLCRNFSKTSRVVVEVDNGKGYAPQTRLRLACGKLQDLGWCPRYDLKEMFERLIIFLKNEI